MPKTVVLVVDDEPETVKYVSANLRARGYEVVAAYDGRSALKSFGERWVDLVILDIMLPGLDGFAVCQAIRQQSRVPVIMLSARGEERDIVRALDLGADDYLTKPFGVEELMARVRSALRRASEGVAAQRPPLTLDELTIDFAARQVAVGGREVVLTRTEFDLLAHLALNAGRVLTHRALLQAVWGPEYGQEAEYLWTYVRRLRRKIEPDPHSPRYILTQAGVGYSLAAPP
ncbi:MAG: response regulator transcription factor [Anaerolineae bacterium]|nr:response regulator transcription factor [Anaerolineae bacterium]